MDSKKLVTNLCALTAIVGLVGCSTPTNNSKKILSTNAIYPAIGPYSQMTAHGNLIFLSGVIPLNKAGNAVEGTTIEEQTKLVLDYIGEKLRSQGLSYEDVLMSNVYMTDLNDFPVMNKIYGEYFKKDPPARATVQVARLPRDVKIEIAVVAGRR